MTLRPPKTPAEIRDERWIRTLPDYTPKTEWGLEYALTLKPTTRTMVTNHKPNSTALINER